MSVDQASVEAAVLQQRIAKAIAAFPDHSHDRVLDNLVGAVARTQVDGDVGAVQRFLDGLFRTAGYYESGALSRDEPDVEDDLVPGGGVPLDEALVRLRRARAGA